MSSDKPAASDALPREGETASRSSEQDEASRKHFEALVQRINDTCARFTPEEMELIKALGWG